MEPCSVRAIVLFHNIGNNTTISKNTNVGTIKQHFSKIKEIYI